MGRAPSLPGSLRQGWHLKFLSGAGFWSDDLICRIRRTIPSIGKSPSLQSCAHPLRPVEHCQSGHRTTCSEARGHAKDEREIVLNCSHDRVDGHSGVLPELTVTPASCRNPLFRMLLKTLPSFNPEAVSQTLSRSLHHAGTGTVLTQPPFPARSTIVQWFSLNCN